MNGSVEVISKTWKHSTISRFSKHNRQSFPIPEKEIFIHACNWIYLGFNWKSSLMRWICYERLLLIPFSSTMTSKIFVVFRNIIDKGFQWFDIFEYLQNNERYIYFFGIFIHRSHVHQSNVIGKWVTKTKTGEWIPKDFTMIPLYQWYFSYSS